MRIKASSLPLTRGEKRWVGALADGYVESVKARIDQETTEALQLPGSIPWVFCKTETSGTHYMYQAGYRVGKANMRYWVIADPRNNFDVHNSGFCIKWGQQVLYET